MVKALNQIRFQFLAGQVWDAPAAFNPEKDLNTKGVAQLS